MIQKPPFLDPIINPKPNDGHYDHLRKDCCIKTAVHDPLAEQFILQLKLKIAFFVDLIGLKLSEQTVTAYIAAMLTFFFYFSLAVEFIQMERIEDG